jgi:hypothetical protein
LSPNNAVIHNLGSAAHVLELLLANKKTLDR